MSGRSTVITRSFEDKLVSGATSLYYSIAEPLVLRVARARYSHEYYNKKQQPLVSVCVPTYNRGALLVERAVKSVLDQSYRNLELVIVGDCCTDNTAELLSKLDDSRIRFFNLPVRKKNYPDTVENHWLAGGAAPTNKALSIARGKWIARIDDDDTWTPDHIEKLVNYAEEGNYEFVSGLYVAERFGERCIVEAKSARDEYYTRRPNEVMDESTKIGGVSTWLYRSYLRFMRFNENCWRKEWNRVWDIDLSLRFYSAGVRMGFLDEVISYVLPRPGEQTIGLDAYMLDVERKLKHYKS
jgi:glycosyltransferase involved in cell wall biosynthesis